MLVDLFIPCFIDQLAPQIGFDTIKVLEAIGCKVRYNPKQTCCGQPAYNAGYFKNAKKVAEKFIEDFHTEADYIVSPSASCVGMVRKSYEDLHLRDQKAYFDIQRKTFEFCEFIVDVLGIRHIKGSKLDALVTYHDSCSALRSCNIKSAPRQLLHHVEALQLVEMEDTETCCGFGGTFAIKFEPISIGMAQQKIQHAAFKNADYIISSDYSCLMHLDACLKKQNSSIQSMHVASVLANGW